MATRHKTGWLAPGRFAEHVFRPTCTLASTWDIGARAAYRPWVLDLLRHPSRRVSRISESQFLDQLALASQSSIFREINLSVNLPDGRSASFCVQPPNSPDKGAWYRDLCDSVALYMGLPSGECVRVVDKHSDRQLSAIGLWALSRMASDRVCFKAEETEMSQSIISQTPKPMNWSEKARICSFALPSSPLSEKKGARVRGAAGRWMSRQDSAINALMICLYKHLDERTVKQDTSDHEAAIWIELCLMSQLDSEFYGTYRITDPSKWRKSVAERVVVVLLALFPLAHSKHKNFNTKALKNACLEERKLRKRLCSEMVFGALSSDAEEDGDDVSSEEEYSGRSISSSSSSSSSSDSEGSDILGSPRQYTNDEYSGAGQFLSEPASGENDDADFLQDYQSGDLADWSDVWSAAQESVATSVLEDEVVVKSPSITGPLAEDVQPPPQSTVAEVVLGLIDNVLASMADKGGVEGKLAAWRKIPSLDSADQAVAGQVEFSFEGRRMDPLSRWTRANVAVCNDFRRAWKDGKSPFEGDDGTSRLQSTREELVRALFSMWDNEAYVLREQDNTRLRKQFLAAQWANWNYGGIYFRAEPLMHRVVTMERWLCLLRLSRADGDLATEKAFLADISRSDALAPVYIRSDLSLGDTSLFVLLADAEMARFRPEGDEVLANILVGLHYKTIPDQNESLRLSELVISTFGEESEEEEEEKELIRDGGASASILDSVSGPSPSEDKVKTPTPTPTPTRKRPRRFSISGIVELFGSATKRMRALAPPTLALEAVFMRTDAALVLGAERSDIPQRLIDDLAKLRESLKSFTSSLIDSKEGKVQKFLREATDEYDIVVPNESSEEPVVVRKAWTPEVDMLLLDLDAQSASSLAKANYLRRRSARKMPLASIAAKTLYDPETKNLLESDIRDRKKSMLGVLDGEDLRLGWYAVRLGDCMCMIEQFLSYAKYNLDKSSDAVFRPLDGSPAVKAYSATLGSTKQRLFSSYKFNKFTDTKKCIHEHLQEKFVGLYRALACSAVGSLVEEETALVSLDTTVLDARVMARLNSALQEISFYESCDRADCANEGDDLSVVLLRRFMKRLRSQSLAGPIKRQYALEYGVLVRVLEFSEPLCHLHCEARMGLISCDFMYAYGNNKRVWDVLDDTLPISLAVERSRKLLSKSVQYPAKSVIETDPYVAEINGYRNGAIIRLYATGVLLSQLRDMSLALAFNPRLKKDQIPGLREPVLPYREGSVYMKLANYKNEVAPFLMPPTSRPTVLAGLVEDLPVEARVGPLSVLWMARYAMFADALSGGYPDGSGFNLAAMAPWCMAAARISLLSGELLSVSRAISDGVFAPLSAETTEPLRTRLRIQLGYKEGRGLFLPKRSNPNGISTSGSTTLDAILDQSYQEGVDPFAVNAFGDPLVVPSPEGSDLFETKLGSLVCTGAHTYGTNNSFSSTEMMDVMSDEEDSSWSKARQLAETAVVGCRTFYLTTVNYGSTSPSFFARYENVSALEDKRYTSSQKYALALCELLGIYPYLATNDITRCINFAAPIVKLAPALDVKIEEPVQEPIPEPGGNGIPIPGDMPGPIVDLSDVPVREGDFGNSPDLMDVDPKTNPDKDRATQDYLLNQEALDKAKTTVDDLKRKLDALRKTSAGSGVAVAELSEKRKRTKEKLSVAITTRKNAEDALKETRTQINNENRKIKAIINGLEKDIASFNKKIETSRKKAQKLMTQVESDKDKAAREKKTAAEKLADAENLRLEDEARLNLENRRNDLIEESTELRKKLENPFSNAAEGEGAGAGEGSGEGSGEGAAEGATEGAGEVSSEEEEEEEEEEQAVPEKAAGTELPASARPGSGCNWFLEWEDHSDALSASQPKSYSVQLSALKSFMDSECAASLNKQAQPSKAALATVRMAQLVRASLRKVYKLDQFALGCESALAKACSSTEAMSNTRLSATIAMWVFASTQIARMYADEDGAGRKCHAILIYLNRVMLMTRSRRHWDCPLALLELPHSREELKPSGGPYRQLEQVLLRWIRHCNERFSVMFSYDPFSLLAELSEDEQVLDALVTRLRAMGPGAPRA